MMLTTSTAQALERTPAEAACAALRNKDLSLLQDAPSRVVKTEFVAANGNTPAQCLVTGLTGSSIGFSLALPASNWNGKLYQHGCGGACGTARLYYCEEPLAKGYACLTTDMGHAGSSGDWMWAYNNLALQVDFGFRSTHQTFLVGKALATAYYQKPPSRSYFYGCSTGGRQALFEAQHFPADFDGIIAGAPAIDETGSALQLVWSLLANSDEHGRAILNEQDILLLHAAVLKQCGSQDGLPEEFLANPQSCKFALASLACGKEKGCLSPDKVEAIRKIYAGPEDRAGQPLYTGGFAEGSELGWIGSIVASRDKPAHYKEFIADFWRYLGFAYNAGPQWSTEGFDFEQAKDRLGMVEPLFGASNPDLRGFQRRGGKLIGFQGWDDTSIAPLNYLDYFKTVQRTMGGEAATQSFFRLFMIPGMGHCTTDGPGADAVDTLSALEAWVERGVAPDAMVGYHIKRDGPQTTAPAFPLAAESVLFTRPIYPYPAVARYRGEGDIRTATSFEPSGVQQ